MLRNPLLWSLAFTAAAAGCAVGPEYQRPAVELPTAWRDVSTNGRAIHGERWWTIYADPALDRVITEALAHNQDLALAAARVDEARGLARSAGAALVPAIDATAQRDRSRSSDRSSIPLPPGTPLERNNYRAQINVAYEIDFWGRLRNADRAAAADLLATRAARETVRIGLTSQVAQSYFALVALDQQIAVTRRTVQLREQNLELQKIRNQSGLIADFDLRQREAEIAAARAQLPALERNRTAEEAALAVLLGRSPRAIFEKEITRDAETDALNSPVVPVVPAELPSEMLLRRPDIVAAEQRMIAANARIGAARAALFPRISLTGYLGSESGALGDLFSGPARIWQLAFGLAQPIFQGGRLQGEIEAAEARQRQAVAQYQKTLQEAFSEVRQALSAQARSREIHAAEAARVSALRETLHLARIRYENGLSSQLEVLDAERNLLQADLNRIDALRAQRSAIADLVKALGGGWVGFDQAATGSSRPASNPPQDAPGRLQ